MINLKKPKSLILTDKYPKKVIEIYLQFKDKANGHSTGMVFYILKTHDEPAKPQYETFQLPLLLNEEKYCLDAIQRIMLIPSFVRWI